MSEFESSQDETRGRTDPDPNSPGALDQDGEAQDGEAQDGEAQGVGPAGSDESGDTDEATVAPESDEDEEDGGGLPDPFEVAGAYARSSQSSQDRGHEEGHYGHGPGSEESHQPPGTGEQHQR